MTPTAGTPGAVTGDLPKVERHIDSDLLTVTVDFTGPDVLTSLACALRRVGLMRTFATLGSAEGLLAEQLRALLSEPAVHDALTLTLSETGAVMHSAAVHEASIADYCERCDARYAVADGLCTWCLPEGER